MNTFIQTIQLHEALNIPSSRQAGGGSAFLRCTIEAKGFLQAAGDIYDLTLHIFRIGTLRQPVVKGGAERFFLLPRQRIHNGLCYPSRMKYVIS
jgi:hypothetical protein